MKSFVSALLSLSVALVANPLFAQDSVASQEQSITGGTLAIVAYILFTATVLGYLALLSMRQRRLDRDIGGLEKRLDELAELDV